MDWDAVIRRNVAAVARSAGAGSLANDFRATNTILVRAPERFPGIQVGNQVMLMDCMSLTFQDGMTFSAHELRELLEWVRLNRAPSRMSAIDAAETPVNEEV